MVQVLAMLPLRIQAGVLAALLRLLLLPTAPYTTVPLDDQRAACGSLLAPYITALCAPASSAAASTSGPGLFPHVRHVVEPPRRFVVLCKQVISFIPVSNVGVSASNRTLRASVGRPRC